MAGSVTKTVFGGPSLIKIGAYGTSKGSCTDIGYSVGNVEVLSEREYHRRKVNEEQGTIDIKVFDRGARLRFTLAQPETNKLRWALDLPSGALTGQKLVNGTRDAQYVTVFIDGPGPDGGTSSLWAPKAVVVAGGNRTYVRDGEVLCDFEIEYIFDTAQSDGEELGWVEDTSVDTTPPTIALSSPVDGGTVTKDTTDTVQWTITEVDNAIDESTIEYGNTFQIINTTTPGSATLVAGTLTYNASTKVVTFTPDSNWNASDTFQVTVSTGLRDMAGNHLATPKIEQFSVTA
jgi:hypothetical protein